MLPEEIKIRKAVESDFEDIYSFLCELEETVFDKKTLLKYYVENLKKSDFYYLVAEIQNQVSGYISLHTQILLHHCGRVGEIQELFVVEKYRSLGIGKLLIDAVIEIAKQEKLESLEVTAQLKREKTHQFYQKSGLSKTHFKFVKTLHKP